VEQKIIDQEVDQQDNKNETNKIMTIEELPDILTAKIIAGMLDLSKRRIYELMDISTEAGGIPKLQIGRSKRVMKTDFIEWLESKKVM
jgi:hypothetical protein